MPTGSVEAMRPPPGLLSATRLVLCALCSLGAALAISGCLSDSTDSSGIVGFADELVVDGLDGPTQLVVADDGDWWVAQLAGGENDRSGQIVRIDPQRPDVAPTVMLEGLDKPTGIALFNDELWVMERDRLSRGPIGGSVDGSDRVVVADDLPNNGRSQGTLTPDGDRLLYNTSGRLEDDGTPTPTSGTLWSVTIDPDTGDTNTDTTIEAVADGFKHAYAHVRADNGTLYTTEIGDGRYDGQPPFDELVMVVPGVDHGWPQCVGNNRVVAEYTEANGDCPDAPPSIALFPPGATPTSVARLPSPHDELLAVALWNTGQLVLVDIGGHVTDGHVTEDHVTDGEVTEDEPGYVVAYEDVERPQHLVLDGDRLLLVAHSAGTIVSLTPQLG